jgi:hypothetical protein
VWVGKCFITPAGVLSVFYGIETLILNNMNAIEFLRSKGILDISDYVAYTAVRPDKDEDEFIPIEQLLEEYAEMKVKNCNTPAVSVNEVAVCPRCKSKEVSVKPITYDCYECGATWQTER